MNKTSAKHKPTIKVSTQTKERLDALRTTIGVKTYGEIIGWLLDRPRPRSNRKIHANEKKHAGTSTEKRNKPNITISALIKKRLDDLSITLGDQTYDETVCWLLDQHELAASTLGKRHRNHKDNDRQSERDMVKRARPTESHSILGRESMDTSEDKTHATGNEGHLKPPTLPFIHSSTQLSAPLYVLTDTSSSLTGTALQTLTETETQAHIQAMLPTHTRMEMDTAVRPLTQTLTVSLPQSETVTAEIQNHAATSSKTQPVTQAETETDTGTQLHPRMIHTTKNSRANASAGTDTQPGTLTCITQSQIHTSALSQTEVGDGDRCVPCLFPRPRNRYLYLHSDLVGEAHNPITHHQEPPSSPASKPLHCAVCHKPITSSHYGVLVSRDLAADLRAWHELDFVAGRDWVCRDLCRKPPKRDLLARLEQKEADIERMQKALQHSLKSPAETRVQALERRIEMKSLLIEVQRQQIHNLQLKVQQMQQQNYDVVSVQARAHPVVVKGGDLSTRAHETTNKTSEHDENDRRVCVKREPHSGGVLHPTEVRFQQLMRELNDIQSVPFPTEKQGLLTPSPDMAPFYKPLRSVESVELVHGWNILREPDKLREIQELLEGELIPHISRLQQLTEPFVIPESDPRTALRGQRGLRMRDHGRRFDIIGFYGGVLAFEGSDHLPHGPFRRSAYDEVAMACSTPIDGRAVLITAIGGTGNHMRFINSISTKAQPTAEEKKMQNCRYAEIKVNGKFPFLLFYLTRAVQAGQELLFEYFADYWPAMELRKREEQQLRDALKATFGPILIE